MDSPVVCLIVLGAVVWAVRRLIKSLKGEGGCGCSGCAGCTTSSPPAADARKDNAPGPDSDPEHQGGDQH